MDAVRTTRRRARRTTHAGQAAMAIEIPRRASSLPSSWIEAGLVVVDNMCPLSQRQTVADDGLRAASLSHARDRDVRPWSPSPGSIFCDSESFEYFGSLDDAFVDVPPGYMYDDMPSSLQRPRRCTAVNTGPGSSSLPRGPKVVREREVDSAEWDDWLAQLWETGAHDNIPPASQLPRPCTAVNTGPGSSSLPRRPKVVREREVDDAGTFLDDEEDEFLHDENLRSVYDDSPPSLERPRPLTAVVDGPGTLFYLRVVGEREVDGGGEFLHDEDVRFICDDSRLRYTAVNNGPSNLSLPRGPLVVGVDGGGGFLSHFIHDEIPSSPQHPRRCTAANNGPGSSSLPRGPEVLREREVDSAGRDDWLAQLWQTGAHDNIPPASQLPRPCTTVTNGPGSSSISRRPKVDDAGTFLDDEEVTSVHDHNFSSPRLPRRGTAADDRPGSSPLPRRRMITSEGRSADPTEPGSNFELDVLRRPGTLSLPLHTLDNVDNAHMSRSRHASPDEAYQDRGDPDSPRRPVDLEAQITTPSAYLQDSVVTGEQNSATKWKARYWAGFFALSFVIFASLALDTHFTDSQNISAVVATSSWAGLTTVLDRAFPVFKDTDMIGLWIVFGALLMSLMAWQSFKENNVHTAT